MLDHGDTASSVSRAYYAMFLAAEAALLTRDIAANSHRAVIAAFGDAFVKDGPLPREDGRALHFAFERRLVADYDATVEFTREEARAILATAEAFVARVNALVLDAAE